MSDQLVGLIGTGVLVLLVFLRVPVAAALILTGGGGYWAVSGFRLARITLGDLPFNLAQAYSLSVVPLFLLMGVVAAKADMARDLYRAFHAILGGLRGGIGMATVAACAGFGAICGSSLATASTMTQVCMPEMRRHGYADRVAAGIVASGGTLGILIPPSIILVIYAIIAQESVPALFAAALVPGIILTLLHVVTLLVIAWFDPEAVPPTPHEGEDRLKAIVSLWKMVVLFTVVVGGIYGGWFSPTEAAAVGAAMTIAIGLATRTLTLRELVDSFRSTIVTTGTLFFIVLGAFVFAAFMVQTQLPATLGEWVLSAGLPPLLVIALFLVAYLVLGCFLDSISMILITVPVFLPIAVAADFSAVWFGVFVVLVAEIGLITPPVGLNLFVIRAQAPDVNLREVYRGILPFIACQLTAVLLLMLFPQIATWLPAQLY